MTRLTGICRRTLRLPAHRRGDTGSATLELAILAPALLILLSLVVLAGRMSEAHAAASHAASEAARAASLARTASTARAAATDAATDDMAGSRLECTTVTVTVDTSGFTRPVGTTATVEVTVTCPVRLSGLLLPGVPGVRTVRATAVSPLDTYRERS